MLRREVLYPAELRGLNDALYQLTMDTSQTNHQHHHSDNIWFYLKCITVYVNFCSGILVDGLNVNREMVRTGNAWVYKKYLKEHSLLDLETEAMDAKRGLWGLPDFREFHRGSGESDKSYSV